MPLHRICVSSIAFVCSSFGVSCLTGFFTAEPCTRLFLRLKARNNLTGRPATSATASLESEFCAAGVHLYSRAVRSACHVARNTLTLVPSLAACRDITVVKAWAPTPKTCAQSPQRIECIFSYPAAHRRANHLGDRQLMRGDRQLIAMFAADT